MGERDTVKRPHLLSGLDINRKQDGRLLVLGCEIPFGRENLAEYNTLSE